MNKESKAALKAGGTTALLGGVILINIGNPVAWAALAAATFTVGKAAYLNTKNPPKILGQTQDQDKVT